MWAVQQITFCVEAVISGKSLGLTRMEFLQVRLEQKKTLNRHLKTWGSAGAWDSAVQTVSVFAFSSVVTVGVRPVGLRSKIIPSSRNVLTLWAMKFWDSV